jgi:hypothetical protein
MIECVHGLSPRANYTERLPLVGEVIANFFAEKMRHVVSVTDPYCCILCFLDRSRCFSIK